MAYTTADFLSSVERKSFAPANQTTFSTSDILAIGDEVLQESIIPALIKVRQEFFVTYLDASITSGVAAYPVPPRAVGSMPRKIGVLDSNSNFSELARISVDKLYLYSSTSSTPNMFYFLDESIVLHPTPASTTNTLRVYYALRPGSLVEVADSAVISGINTLTNVITVTTIPSTWVTGSVFDLISAIGNQKYYNQATDLTSTLVSGTSITLPSLPSGLAVGDYISLAGTSPLIQLPAEFRPAFAMLTAAAILDAQNQPNAEKLFQKGMLSLKTAQDMVASRDPGDPEVIMPDWS